MIAWLRHIKEPAGIAMEKASQDPVDTQSTLWLKSEIQSLRGEVKSLSESRKHLKAEVIRLSSELLRSQDQLQSAIILFESRVDQIYHSIMQTLPHLVKGGHLLALPENPDHSTGTALETKEEWASLIRAAAEEFITPRKFVSPLTLSGFRIDTRFACECLDFIRIFPDAEGIVVFGPYKKLLTGIYDVAFAVELVDNTRNTSLEFEVLDSSRDITVATSVEELRPGKDNYQLSFLWTEESTYSPVEFRIKARGGGEVLFHQLDLSKRA